MNTIKTALIVTDSQFHYSWSGPPLVALIGTDSTLGLLQFPFTEYNIIFKR